MSTGTKVEGIFAESRDFAAFVDGYVNYLKSSFDRVDAATWNALADQLDRCADRGGTLFLIGNGGSAATASHMANDFIKMSELSRKRKYRVLSLTDNVSAITAIGNDYGYEQIFVKQLENLATSKDLVLGISVSGNSPNVVKALEWARERGMSTVGFLGFDGGKCKPLCDVPVVFPSIKGEYNVAEDAHMIMDHMLSTYLHFRNR
jgi:D-sedoheptulose 7-phosphate isomerase